MLAKFTHYLQCIFGLGVTLKAFIQFKDVFAAHEIFIPLAKTLTFVYVFAILLHTFQSICLQKSLWQHKQFSFANFTCWNQINNIERLQIICFWISILSSGVLLVIILKLNQTYLNLRKVKYSVLSPW